MDQRFRLALHRRCEELGVPVPKIEVKKLNKYPDKGVLVLYFFIHHGALVYVGMSKNFRKRMNRHKHSGYQKLTERTGVYISVLSCTYEELRKKEAALISHLQPALNLQA